MAVKVYKAGPGWVKQFEDGSVAGPFATRDLADSAQKVVEVPKPVKSMFGGKQNSDIVDTK